MNHVVQGLETQEVAVGDADVKVLLHSGNHLDEHEGIQAGSGLEGLVRGDFAHGEIHVILEDIKEFLSYVHGWLNQVNALS